MINTSKKLLLTFIAGFIFTAAQSAQSSNYILTNFELVNSKSSDNNPQLFLTEDKETSFTTVDENGRHLELSFTPKIIQTPNRQTEIEMSMKVFDISDKKRKLIAHPIVRTISGSRASITTPTSYNKDLEIRMTPTLSSAL